MLFSVYRCVAALAAVAGSAIAGSPSLVIVGENGADTPHSFAYCVSGDGSTMGGFTRMGTGIRGFRWRADSGLVLLDPVTAEPSELDIPFALSHDGSVVFGYSQIGVEPVATRWDASGSPQTLGTIGTDPLSGFSYSNAVGCSPDGSVAVGFSTSSSGKEAMRWTLDGLQGLGGLRTSGLQDAQAFAIDSAGVIRGHAKDDLNRLRLFRWAENDGIEEIPQSLFTQQIVVDASPDGRALTGGALREGITVGVPYVWTESGGSVELPMPAGSNAAFGYAVSDGGTVVAGRYEPAPTSPGTSGWLWTPQGGVVDLLDYCRDTLAIDPGDWVLYPEDIDAAGRFLVGVASYHPDGSAIGLAEAAFILDLRPPCTADLAEPFGSLNVFDILEYIARYNLQDPSADLAEPYGAFNIFDILAYMDSYNAGCP